ncbi:MarR family winged helix-turn-helix transcriptional regulator [Deinococcus maricopensis]|uniref:Transcriptional regulator, MarR family n=1 Tax=Deinococcus maricopensis (strain DSM 21211 / LMG 22137 / NRRL B-23946 / LB-34) TaxID=709986 RepID=E8U440_DEIML|nr:MarR family winged helix-turn-helix transcriptional regulator [Deinococcus maricopensis]ADV65877.1 transcriptional regulator, MarR family [Deinococcus maricopensis DSM 21211]
MDTTTDVDPLTLMRRFGRLYRLLHATAQPHLEQAVGLHTKELQVLSAISAGQTSPSQISARVGTPPPSTSRLIDTLVSAGHVERRGDPNDLRRFQLTLTEQGARTLTEARAVIRTALADLFAGVPADDLRDVDQSITRLQTQLGLQED